MSILGEEFYFFSEAVIKLNQIVTCVAASKLGPVNMCPPIVWRDKEITKPPYLQ